MQRRHHQLLTPFLPLLPLRRFTGRAAVELYKQMAKLKWDSQTMPSVDRHATCHSWPEVSGCISAHRSGGLQAGILLLQAREPSHHAMSDQVLPVARLKIRKFSVPKRNLHMRLVHWCTVTFAHKWIGGLLSRRKQPLPFSLPTHWWHENLGKEGLRVPSASAATHASQMSVVFEGCPFGDCLKGKPKANP